jgi:hypothetical protein
MDPFTTAEEKLGASRAEELRDEIDQLTEDLEKLRSIPLELDDEP